MSEEQKMKFKVTVEHTDVFGQEMSGSSSANIEYNDEIYPGYELIEAFEKAFLACGFSQQHLDDYYAEKYEI